MASSFVIEMHAEEAVARLGLLADEIPAHIRVWLVECAELAKKSIEDRAPEGVAGAMGQGIKHNIDTVVTATEAWIGPNKNVPYAIYVEEGTRPHRPPAGPDSALAQWCEMKGLEPWAVATSIAKNGTQPHPFVEPAYEDIKDVIPAKFEEGIARMVGVDL
ncbi:MAG TPA: hypothetical protein VFH39_04170 [Candidatus Saccharimonadales bacterium]|nr:hypothetical protein [Candidatus Saccharimonadales bacterium]